MVVTAVENVWTLEPGFWKLEGWMSVISFVDGLILQWFISPFGHPGAELVLRLFFFKVSVWLIFFLLLLLCCCLPFCCVGLLLLLLCLCDVGFMSHFSNQLSVCWSSALGSVEGAIPAVGRVIEDCSTSPQTAEDERVFLFLRPQDEATSEGKKDKDKGERLVANDKQGKSTGFLSAGKVVCVWCSVSIFLSFFLMKRTKVVSCLSLCP